MIFINQTLTWFANPEQWSGDGSIPVRMVEHLLFSLLIVLIAAAIAIPIGLFFGHRRSGANLIIAITGAARAIPTLGLLTILGLALGIGLLAPGIALIILAIPPLLAGTYSGISNVGADTVKAARAMGMSEWQLFRMVEIPLAMPLIVGGVHAAITQVIATATLAAFTADVGLGRFIFAGLKTRDYGEMIGGALLVVLISLLAEAIFSSLHTIQQPRAVSATH